MLYVAAATILAFCSSVVHGRLQDDLIFADNGVIRVGMSLTRGGSIAYLGVSGGSDGDNVINAHDMGREVQLSFYDGPSFYNPPTAKYPSGACDKLFGGQEWPWNPIGAGDVDGNHGDVLSLDKSVDDKGNIIGWRIVTRPLQWACHNVSCECTFEQTVSIVNLPGNTGVKIVSTLHNDRSDPTVYPPRTQELPATYTNGAFSRLIAYTGSAPFTNGNTTEFITGFRGPGAKGGAWIPGQISATENWAALVNGDGFGMGVVNPNTTAFLGGFSGPKRPGGSTDPQTGYIAPISNVQLGPKVTYTFTSFLVLGDISTIRSFAQQVVN